MIKCVVITTAGKTTDIFDENKTPKEVLDYFGIDYAAASNKLDGVPLTVESMNKSLRELGVKKDCRISSIVKIDNAAKIVVTGSAAVLTSSVSREDWARIQELSPESLVLTDEETDEVLYKVGLEDGSGTMNEYGTLFGNVVNHEGKATVTVLLDPALEDQAKAVRAELGKSLLYLNEIEKAVPDIMKEIDEMEKEINENIVLM